MMHAVKALVALEEQIDKAEADLKAMKDQAEKLNEEVQDLFISEGIQNIGVDGKTVYISRQVWTSVKPERKEEARKVLEAIGLGDFVKESVNTQQLSAWVRERMDSGEGLPAELDGLVKVTEKLGIRIKKA